jgi:hypothetical protein
MTSDSVNSKNTVKTYLDKLEKFLSDRDLIDFWVPVNGDSFKPLYGLRRKNLVKYLMENADRYSNSKIAHIRIIINQQNIPLGKNVLTIKLETLKINDDGRLGAGNWDSWGTLINFSVDQLKARKFSLKLLKSLTLLCGIDDKFGSDLITGSDFETTIRELKKNVKTKMEKQLLSEIRGGVY